MDHAGEQGAQVAAPEVPHRAHAALEVPRLAQAVPEAPRHAHAAPGAPRRALAAIQKVPRWAQAARGLGRRAQAALPKVRRRTSPAVCGYVGNAHAAPVSNRRRSGVRAPRLQPAGRPRSKTTATTVRAWPPRPSVSRRASSSRYPRRVSPTPRSSRRSVSLARNSARGSPRVARFGDARETRQRRCYPQYPAMISTVAQWCRVTRERSRYDASPRPSLGAASSRQRVRDAHPNSEVEPREPDRARWPCAASSRRRARRPLFVNARNRDGPGEETGRTERTRGAVRMWCAGGSRAREAAERTRA